MIIEGEDLLPGLDYWYCMVPGKPVNKKSVIIFSRNTVISAVVVQYQGRRRDGSAMLT